VAIEKMGYAECAEQRIDVVGFGRVGLERLHPAALLPEAPATAAQTGPLSPHPVAATVTY
jgi:hypothetical protein